MVNERIIILGAISDWLIVGPVRSAATTGGARPALYYEGVLIFRLFIHFND